MRRLFTAFLVSLAPVTAQAQGWSMDASLGGADHQTVSRDVGTRSAILGVRHTGMRWLYLFGAVPLDTLGLPWAAAGLGARLGGAAPGALSLGLDLGAHGHAYRERLQGASGGGVTLEGLPFVALTHGATRLEAYLGGRTYSSTFAGNTFSRGVLDAGSRLSYTPDSRLALTGTTQWVRAAEGSFPRVGSEIRYTGAVAEGWAHAARWLSSSLSSVEWSLGGAVRVGGGLRAEVVVQQDASDPLYWNDPRRFWSIGLSRPFAAAPDRSPPVPPLPMQPGGRVVLRLSLAEAAEAPAVAGDFNGWTPVPMRRGADGWEVDLSLPPGVYHYAFRRADGSWFVPESTPGRVDDGFGGVNAVLVVRAPT